MPIILRELIFLTNKQQSEVIKNNLLSIKYYSEQEVQELKDKIEGLLIEITNQGKDNILWRGVIFLKNKEIEKLKKENEELKEQIEELKSKLEYNSDKELLKALEQEEKGRKK